ncbi:MAG: DUF2160 domain-containing protein [Reinekea sp.]|jgi:predicted small integral membrane protein|nr:DUF2160 domain-containing protein [Reinekea sp.]
MAWMSWTLPTALFFSAIGLILIGMTIWQTVSPSVERQGVIPLPTTRGDRLFIGLLSSAFIHLAYVASTELHVAFATVFCLFWMMAVMRWG